MINELEMNVVRIIEPCIADNGMLYYETPELAENEYIAGRVKRTTKLIRPTGDDIPYLAKDVALFWSIVNSSTELVIVER